MTRICIAVGGLACGVALLVVSPARAGGPFTERHSTATIGGRRGLALAPGVSATPWAYGLGAHLGYTVYGGTYFGLAVDSYPFDQGEEHYPGTQEVRITGYLGTALAELGYDWRLTKWLVLRTTGGLGAAWGSYELCSEQTDTEGDTETVCEDGKNPRGAVGLKLAPLVHISKRMFLLGNTEWLIDTGFDDRTTGVVFAFDFGWRF